MREPLPFPGPEGERLVISAAGSRRFCALPVYERFSKRIDGRRGGKLSFLYAEYVEACKACGERPYAYTTFCSGLRAWRRELARASAPEWYPGEYMRTYWSLVRPESEPGAKPIILFVAQLEHSDATFAARAKDMGVASWMRCCEEAFRWFGGVPYVTDCAMCRISKTAQATIEAFARHYGTVLYGARPKSGKTAAGSDKPEEARNSSAVLRELRATLGALGSLSVEDVDCIIAEKVGQLNALPLGGRSRLDALEEDELPRMLELPPCGADLATWSTRIVGPDHHIVILGVRYSVPYPLVGEKVKVSWTEERVRAYFDGRLVADHALPADPGARRSVTDDSHRPPRHRWFADRMRERFMPRALESGRSTAKVMEELLEACRRERSGYKRCKQLLGLREAPSQTSLEEACAKVVASGEEVSLDAVLAAMGAGAAS